MKKIVVSGLVKKVENIHDHLSFITLTPIVDAGWTETRIPVYTEVGQEYVGMPVNITTMRKGWLFKIIEQTVETFKSATSVEIPQSLAERIIDAYAQSEMTSITSA